MGERGPFEEISLLRTSGTEHTVPCTCLLQKAVTVEQRPTNHRAAVSPTSAYQTAQARGHHAQHPGISTPAACVCSFTSPLPPATFKHDEVLSHTHFWLHEQSLVHRLPFYPLPASWESAVSRGKLRFPAAEEGSSGTAGTCRMAACHSVSELGNKWGQSLHRVNEKGYLGEITESIGNSKHPFRHWQSELSLHAPSGGPGSSCAFVEQLTGSGPVLINNLVVIT